VNNNITIKTFLQNLILNPYSLLVVSLLITIFTYDDYGIAWDEPMQRQFGLNAYSYMFSEKNIDYIENFGPVYEVYLVSIEKALNITDIRDIYLFRHLINHLFFLLSALCFYFLITMIFERKDLALIAMVFLLISPRIYAHSFFNTKDVPFLCSSIFTFYFCHQYLLKRKWLYLVMIAILFATMVNIRLAGTLLVFLFSLYIVIVSILNRYNLIKLIFHSVSVIIISTLVLYATWPFLWDNTFENLNSFFTTTLKYFWDYPVLYRGQFYNGSQLPWHYLLTWLGISIPVNYLILLFTGILATIISLIKNNFNDKKSLTLLTGLLWFILPIVLVFINDSTIYDDWRHLYFIYPAMLILSVAGIEYLLLRKKAFLKIIAFGLITYSIIPMFWMFNNHPFQAVYFNELVSKKKDYIRFHYEQDYWGACFKDGFEYILKNDTSSKINIVVTKLPGELNHMILKPKDRLRIQYVQDFKKADYFVTHYRVENYDFPDLGKPWYYLTVNNSRILAIWKFKK